MQLQGAEPGSYLVHAGISEQQRGVIQRDGGRGVHVRVPVLLEEVNESLPDLARCQRGLHRKAAGPKQAGRNGAGLVQSEGTSAGSQTPPPSSPPTIPAQPQHPRAALRQLFPWLSPGRPPEPGSGLRCFPRPPRRCPAPCPRPPPDPGLPRRAPPPLAPHTRPCRRSTRNAGRRPPIGCVSRRSAEAPPTRRLPAEGKDARWLMQWWDATVT